MFHSMQKVAWAVSPISVAVAISAIGVTLKWLKSKAPKLQPVFVVAK